MAVGDELTCTSSSILSTYSFTDSDGTVTDGNTVTLSEEGSFSFTCTATVAMDTPCTATASVSGTAVGKEHRRLFTYIIRRCRHTQPVGVFRIHTLIARFWTTVFILMYHRPMCGLFFLFS